MARADGARADRPATCGHRPPCPGCPRYGEPGIAAEVRAILDALARSHGVPPPSLVSGALAGFRHRARLAIRGRLGSPKIGLFETGTHRVVHIPDCPVHHPLINRVASIVRRALIDAGVTCYSDAAHLGLARYLQVVVERRSQSAQVVLVGNSAMLEPLRAPFEAIRAHLGSQLHSLWFNPNQERTNTILGREFLAWCGPPSVVERFGGAEVHYPPGAFGQNNLDIADEIVAYLRAEVPAGARVAEFYAGVGAIGLSLLDRAAELRMNEFAPSSLHGLALGLAALGKSQRAKVSVWPGTAAAAAPAARAMDVVIADPPRKGLDAGLVASLVAAPPPRLLYVSCDPRSLAGDAAALGAGGALRLRSLRAFNLFPFTEHVETVAVFEREC
ncbi:MAG TPA: hypothetical protein VMU86_05685 [Steroidobacteraceae bacterium]|nr:hypothetical protein [Steroidobacteraceae bacterium]